MEGCQHNSPCSVLSPELWQDFGRIGLVSGVSVWMVLIGVKAVQV